MTEAEWLSATDPMRMLHFLEDAVSERKLRLFSLECCRRVPDLCQRNEARQEARRAIDALEQCSEELLPVEELADVDWFPLDGRSRRDSEALFILHLATRKTYHLVPTVKSLCNRLTRFVCDKGSGSEVEASAETLEASRQMEHRCRSVEDRRHELILRDIFGNPFRPVAVDSAWRTSTVLTLARNICHSRDFSLMPILADALQDAGCDNPDILNHCRLPGEHVRGCWVVDLLLGNP